MEDEEFSVNIRKIPALAFVAPGQVIDAFERLSDHITENYGQEVDQLLDYFEVKHILVDIDETPLEQHHCLW